MTHKEMVADYFSKPLQGSLFKVHQNSIMVLTEVGKSHEYLGMMVDFK